MHTPTKLGAAVLSAALLLAIPSQAMAADTNPQGGDNHFDLQAHRGGLGLTVESTLPAFAKALETGVTTLELDLQITRDGREVITHDRKISDKKCADTAPVTPGDPQFPYAGKYVKDLTFAQVRSPTAARRRCRSSRASRPPLESAHPGRVARVDAQRGHRGDGACSGNAVHRSRSADVRAGHQVVDGDAGQAIPSIGQLARGQVE